MKKYFIFWLGPMVGLLLTACQHSYSDTSVCAGQFNTETALALVSGVEYARQEPPLLWEVKGRTLIINTLNLKITVPNDDWSFKPLAFTADDRSMVIAFERQPLVDMEGRQIVPTMSILYQAEKEMTGQLYAAVWMNRIVFPDIRSVMTCRNSGLRLQDGVAFHAVSPDTEELAPEMLMVYATNNNFALQLSLEATRSSWDLIEKEFLAIIASLEWSDEATKCKRLLESLRYDAALGDPNAQAELGIRYLEGRCVSRDPVKALNWLRQAADQESAVAQFYLGLAYQHGVGLSRDEQEAFDCFLDSAEAGYAPAMNNLGRIYLKGHAIPRDGERAVFWYIQAARNNWHYAQFELGGMFESGVVWQVDPEIAVALYERSAEVGHSEAQYRLGKMYAEGREVPPDKSKAFALWTIAAAQGLKKAEYERQALAQKMTAEDSRRAQKEIQRLILGLAIEENQCPGRVLPYIDTY